MARKTHQKQLERDRARRMAQRQAQRAQRRRIIAAVVILAFAATAVGALALGGGDDAPVPAPTPSPSATAAADDPCPDPSDAPTPSSPTYDAPPGVTIDTTAAYVATIETTCGTITAELFAAETPATVSNFVRLAEDDYYVGVPFHRVIQGFMIQGGDPSGTGTGLNGTYPGYTIPDELDNTQLLHAEAGGYLRGWLAMARTAAPDSAGSQFFIMQNPEGQPYRDLPPQYVVFGQVTDGMDVVDDIAAGTVDGDRAVTPVRILDVTIDQQET